jgi:hypothetical protein
VRFKFNQGEDRKSISTGRWGNVLGKLGRFWILRWLSALRFLCKMIVSFLLGFKDGGCPFIFLQPLEKWPYSWKELCLKGNCDSEKIWERITN